jgi:hypothetical protein
MLDIIIVVVLVTVVALAAKLLAARLEREYSYRQRMLRSLHNFAVACGGECVTHTIPFMCPHNRGRVVVRVVGQDTLEIDGVLWEIKSGIEETV